MKKPDWTQFCKRISINKPIKDVYNAWATPSLLKTWFLEEAVYVDKDNQPRKPDDLVKKGDSFTWKWNNWEFEEKGTVLEENGTDKISFSFGKGGNVLVQLRSLQNGTEVELIQENIPADDQSKYDIFVGCATGWTFWMTNLKAWLEHGITLHATGLKQEETDDLVNS